MPTSLNSILIFLFYEYVVWNPGEAQSSWSSSLIFMLSIFQLVVSVEYDLVNLSYSLSLELRI